MNDPNPKPNLVLVIEDNKQLADMYEEVLTDCGFAVEKFYDGKLAYERVSSEDKPVPALVLLDLQLPRVSGDEIAWQMWFTMEKTHIIVITGDDERGPILRGKPSVDMVLMKPILPGSLEEITKPYLELVK